MKIAAATVNTFLRRRMLDSEMDEIEICKVGKHCEILQPCSYHLSLILLYM